MRPEWLFDSLFARFRWWRRLVGGHWERWYVDHPFCAFIWHRVPACSYVIGRRPTAGCRGTATCEEF